jgi:vancomycin resistance protein YoaR
VGPSYSEKGYEKAIVYINKEKVEDYGGGVCQVPPPCDNAVLQAVAGFGRHPTACRVPYFPREGCHGKLCTLDLKFKNDRARDID